MLQNNLIIYASISSTKQYPHFDVCGYIHQYIYEIQYKIHLN